MNEGNPTERRYRVALKVAILILGMTFVAGYAQVRWEHRDVVEQHGMVDETPYIALVPNSTRTHGAAVLFHGARCSAAMMIPLGRMLARNGVPTFIPDLPGHGRSPSRIGLSCSSSDASNLADCDPLMPSEGVVEGVLAALPRVKDFADRPLVIIGHSWGGRMVARFDAAATSARVEGRISLEGGGGPGHRGNNELYVGGTRFEARHPNDPKANVLLGRFEDGTAFEYVRTGKSHLALIHDSGANESILAWTEKVFGEPLGRDTRVFYVLPAGLSAILLLIVVLVFALTLRRGDEQEPAVAPRDALICLVALLVSAVVCRLGADRLIESNRSVKAAHSIGFLVLPYLQAVGMLAAPACFWRLRHWARRRAIASYLKEAWFAAVVFGAVYVFVLGYIDSNFLHASIAPRRIPRFLLLTLLSLPIAFLVRGALPTAVRQSRWRFLAIVVVWWALLTGWGIGGPAEAWIELIEISASILVIEGIVLVVRRSTAFSTAFVSLSLGCLFASLYPLLAGLDFVP